MNNRKRQGDLDAESTLIRAAVEHPAKVAAVLEMVQPDEFTDSVCAKIWEAVQTLSRSGRRVGFDEILDELEPDEILGPDGATVG